MPHISARDGTRLYYEEAGSGSAVVFVHEYAGDWRSWEAQMRHFSRAHRCITFSQRGYPPSDVPEDGARYSQDIFRDDVIALMDALKIDTRPYRRPFHGRLHRAACRHPLSRPLHFRGGGRLRLGLDAGRQAARGHEGARRRDRQNVRRGGFRQRRREICRRAHAPGAKAQGPARPRRIRKDAGRAFPARPRAHHVQPAAQAPDAVGDGSRAPEVLRCRSW